MVPKFLVRMYVPPSQIFVSQSFPKNEECSFERNAPSSSPFSWNIFHSRDEKNKDLLDRSSVSNDLFIVIIFQLIFHYFWEPLQHYTYGNVPYVHSDAFLSSSSRGKIKRMSFIVTDSPAAMQNTYRIVTENAKNSSPQRACSGNGSILRFSISDFHLCSGGTVVHTLCPRKSIFWVALSCCIPLSSFPCRSNCLTIN